MIVERHSNLKEEVDGSSLGCEISSLLDRDLPGGQLFVIHPHKWSCKTQTPLNSFKPSPFSTPTTILFFFPIDVDRWQVVRCWHYMQSNVTMVALCCTSIGVVGGIMHWTKLHGAYYYARVVSVFEAIGTCLHTCVSYPVYSKTQRPTTKWKQRRSHRKWLYSHSFISSFSTWQPLVGALYVSPILTRPRYGNRHDNVSSRSLRVRWWCHVATSLHALWNGDRYHTSHCPFVVETPVPRWLHATASFMTVIWRQEASPLFVLWQERKLWLAMASKW